MVAIGAILAILLFLYLNHQVANKRDQRRAERLERHKELLDQTLDLIRKNEKHRDGPQ